MVFSSCMLDDVVLDDVVVDVHFLQRPGIGAVVPIAVAMVTDRRGVRHFTGWFFWNVL
jgi:hypothetical protein